MNEILEFLLLVITIFVVAYLIKYGIDSYCLFNGLEYNDKEENEDEEN